MIRTKTGLAAVGAAGLLAICWAAPAVAQDNDDDEPRRYRIGAGAQVKPSFPGSEDVSLRPMFDISRARGDTPFDFEAPDEGFGFSLFGTGDLSFGFAVGFEGSRKRSEIGANLPKVDFTVEAGAFAQYEMTDNIRLRVEGRRGLGGHDGWIGSVGADYVARDGDDWLFSIGPRLTLSDNSYQDAYFSVAPEYSGPSGLPTYDADGGLHAAGVTASFLKQLTPRWGIYSYAKYDRLIGDAGDSPIVRELGSRNQFSGGAALTYTFGG